jgi:hypothetical protein
MKAMSNFVLVARQGAYGRRPKVEMPENTESACREVNCCSQGLSLLEESDLCSTITWKSVVPQLLEWASQWFLVMGVVAVGSYSCCEAENSRRKLHFEDG